MARTIEKNKALKLRRKGKSINEIAKSLNIPKSTVSIWCRDIQLSPKQIERLAKKQESGSYKGRMRFLEKVRKQRIEEIVRLKRRAYERLAKLAREIYLLLV